jgi:hypothetical protein
MGFDCRKCTLVRSAPVASGRRTTKGRRTMMP